MGVQRGRNRTQVPDKENVVCVRMDDFCILIVLMKLFTFDVYCVRETERVHPSERRVITSDLQE